MPAINYAQAVKPMGPKAEKTSRRGSHASSYQEVLSMQFQFSFKHMDTSDALQAYAQDKLLEKIQKFVSKPVEAHVSFSVLKHEHRAHCTFRAGDGFSLEVEHSCSDMYGSIDHMVDKLGAQLKKQKEKLKDHKQPKLSRHLKEATATDEPTVDATDILKYERGRKRSGAR